MRDGNAGGVAAIKSESGGPDDWLGVDDRLGHSLDICGWAVALTAVVWVVSWLWGWLWTVRVQSRGDELGGGVSRRDQSLGGCVGCPVAGIWCAGLGARDRCRYWHGNRLRDAGGAWAIAGARRRSQNPGGGAYRIIDDRRRAREVVGDNARADWIHWSRGGPRVDWNRGRGWIG